MTTFAEAIVIAAITLAPFAIALCVAAAIVGVARAGRIGRRLGLDVRDGDR